MSAPEGRPSRKRSLAECDDTICDFTPLSKRINNLHLTKPPVQEEFSPRLEEQHHAQQNHAANGHMNGFNGHGQQPGQPGGSSNHHQHHEQLQHLQPNNSWITDQMLAQYAPTIQAGDSPHYYEHNKLLFALFVERQQRNPHNPYPEANS